MKKEKPEFSKEQVIIPKATPESIEATNKYMDEHPEYRHLLGMMLDIMNMLKAICEAMGLIKTPPQGRIVKPQMNVRINPKSLGEN